MRALNAEWIDCMEAYRLYDAKAPQQTVAYETDLDAARQRAEEEGYSLVVD